MLIGHDDIVNDLKRLAKNGELPHGYIFFGPAMVGKRTTAMRFANFLETGEFEESKLLQDGLLVSPDENGTLGIDAVRELKLFLSEKPNLSKKRTAIIDGGESLTTEAQGALLKVAEEPPRSAFLVLVTNDVEGLLPTIASRLQKIYFGTVSKKEIGALCMEHGAKKEMAENAAGASFGKPGLALRLVGDMEFRKSLKTAENLLKLSGEKRREFVKKLLEDDDFDLAKLLDAMIILISADAAKDKANIARWHKFLALRRDTAYFNLNPKLQLENLLSN